MNLYTNMDELSREAIFYVANDYGMGLGLGVGIIACSFALKTFFLPLLTYTQLTATKMKLIEPEMKNF